MNDLAPWDYVVRYFCKLPSYKAVTLTEIITIHAAGVAFLAVWEQGQADWQLGATKGLEHGQLAVAFAHSVRYPPDLPILFAFDTNAVPSDARARAYGTAAADVVEAAGFGFGVYGDHDVIRVLQDRSRLNWLAGATYWSDPTKPYQPETMPGYELVHVRQVISGSTPNYDRNITLRPFPAWLPHEVAAPIEAQPPTPQPEDDMADLFTHSDPDHEGHPAGHTWWRVMEDGTKRHVTAVEYAALGTPTGPALLMSQIDQLADWTPPATTITSSPNYVFSFSGTGSATAQV
jgi:hypothetical protein